MPPSFARAAATALDAPVSLRRSTPASQEVADKGSGCPDHRFTDSIMPASSISKASVASAGGRGRTLNEISVNTPRVPNAPAMSRETSYPATFLMTRPPKERSSPFPLTMRVPRTKSRTAPAKGRRGPEKLHATVPPIVAASPKPGGSKASIWPSAASARSMSAIRVPAFTVSTSSRGS